MRDATISNKFVWTEYILLLLILYSQRVDSLDYHCLKAALISDQPTFLPRGGGTNEATVLNFEGSFRDSTPPLPKASWKRVEEFFQDPRNRDLVLKGGANPTEQVVATQDLYALWKEQSSIVQSVAPSPPHDPIILISSTVSLLPGLSIAAKSWMGCKLLHNERTKLPIYEFTLIKDDYNPQGIKFMVWLFNQVTGNNDKSDNKATNTNRQTHGLSRIFMEPATDDSEGLVMHYFGFVKVSCTVPRRVLSFLPLSKAKAEEKVSNAIVKQLQREGIQSLKKFQSAFEEWLSNVK